jgi:hypothetical protein
MEALWSKVEKNDEYDTNKALYQTHILEQYKIYVEMADRISARRNLANIFFLTLHTTILGVVGFAFQKIELVNPKWLTTLPFIGVIILCFVWWWLLLSYRQLNTAKYKVIGQLEEKLPASPYWFAEWKELGEGKDRKKYIPLTVLEKIVPTIFGVLYFMIWVYINFFML